MAAPLGAPQWEACPAGLGGAGWHQELNPAGARHCSAYCNMYLSKNVKNPIESTCMENAIIF